MIQEEKCQNKKYKNIIISSKWIVGKINSPQKADLIINRFIIMQFYHSSTPLEARKELPNSKPKAQNTLDLPIFNANLPQGVYFYYFNQYCTELLGLSNHLNKELLKNNDLISCIVQKKDNTSSQAAQSKKDSEDNSTTDRKNTSQFSYYRKEGRGELAEQINKKIGKRRRVYESNSEDSYKPDEDESKDLKGSKASESKNIPKNYGKAILAYIRRNQDFTIRILQKYQLDYEQFMHSLKTLRINLNTISDLRNIWLDEQNKYAKVFRILSYTYLRKHSLSYIFNSRVENFHKHIKYRYKMLEGVINPHEFTCIKEF